MENKEKVTFYISVILLLIISSVNTYVLIDSRARIISLSTLFAAEFPRLEKFSDEMGQLIIKGKYNFPASRYRKVEFLNEPYCLVGEGRYKNVILFQSEYKVGSWELKTNNYLEYKKRSPDFPAHLQQGVGGVMIKFENDDVIYFPTNFTINGEGKVTHFFIYEMPYELCRPARKW